MFTFNKLLKQGILMTLFIIIGSLNAFAQFPERLVSDNFNPPNSWANNNGTGGLSTIVGTRIITVQANGTAGNKFFRFTNTPATENIGPNSGPGDAARTVGTPFTLFHTNSGGSFFFNVSDPTNQRIVFKTAGSGSGTARALIMILGGVPSTITGVSRSPEGVVQPNEVVTVRCTVSAALPSGQGVFLRSTTDNFASSTVTEMTLESGNVYSATIAGRAAGVAVSYYVFSSRSGGTIAHADADLYTINLNNNGGSNFSYTVIAPKVFTGSGNWSTAARWTGGTLPISTDEILIQGTCTLDVGDVTVGRIIVDPNATFVASSSSPCTLRINAPSNRISLQLNGNAVWNNGTGGSTVIFTGPASATRIHTVSGNVTLNNVVLSEGKSAEFAGVDFGASTATTINGIMQINAGGYIENNAPIYATNSTLRYNVNYDRNREWSSTTAGQKGAPSNVELANNATVNLNVNQLTNMTIGGNLAIAAGCTLTAGSNPNPLTVQGNTTLHGSLILSTAANTTNNFNGNITTFSPNGQLVLGTSVTNSDLNFRGSLMQIRNANGLVHNNREIRFVGTINQQLANWAGLSLAFLQINNTGAAGSNTVTFDGFVTITNRVRLDAGRFDPSSFLNLDGGNFERSGGIMNSGINQSNSFNYSLTYSGTNELTTGNEILNDSRITSITFNNTGGVSLNRNVSLSSGRNYNFSSGAIVNTNGFTMGGAGTINLNTGEIRISNTGGIGATLTAVRNFTGGNIRLIGGGSQNLGIVGGLISTPVFIGGPGNTNNSTVTLDGSATIGRLVIEQGSTFNCGNSAFNLTFDISSTRNVITNNAGGTFTPGNGKVIFRGSGGFSHQLSGTFSFFNIDIQPSSGTMGVDFGGSATITIGGTLTMFSGSFTTNAPTYSENSTLVYRNTGSFNVTTEWSNPFNVQVTNNTTVNIFGTNRTVRGNLTIDAGSEVNLGGTGSNLTVNGNIINAGTIRLGTAIGSDLFLQGDLELNGTGSSQFISNGREIRFNGTNAQSIAGTNTTAQTYTFFAVAKASGNFNILVPLNFNNGSSTARFLINVGTNNSVNLNSQAITFGGSGVKQLRLEQGTLITGTSNISGFNEFTTQETVNSTVGGTVRFNGGPQTIPAATYTNITLENTGAKTINANITVTGRLRILGSATLEGAGNVSYSGANVELEYNPNTAADITVSNKEWPNTNGPATVRVNLAEGFELDLNANKTLSNSLILTSGNLNTGSFKLTLGTSGTNPGTLTASANSKIVGTLERWIGATPATYVFPMGSATQKQQVSLNFTTAPTTQGTITASFVSGAPGTTGLPLSSNGISITRVSEVGYWTLTNTNNAGFTYNITAVANNFTGISQVDKLYLIKRANSSSNWALEGTAVTSTGTPSSVTLQTTGLTSFSDFGLGSNDENVLPVTLLSFSAKIVGNNAMLNWSTANETNSSHFEVLRSEDGQTFKAISQVKSIGNEAKGAEYSSLDANIPAEWNSWYYRLLQVDKDGTKNYGPIVRISRSGKLAALEAKLFPNPAKESVSLQILNADASKFNLILSNSSGKIIGTTTGDLLNINKNLQNWFNGLSKGVYFVQVNDGQQRVSLKLVKE